MAQKIIFEYHGVFVAVERSTGGWDMVVINPKSGSNLYCGFDYPKYDDAAASGRMFIDSYLNQSK